MPTGAKAWGIGGRRRSVDRELVIRMGDNMRFTPDHLEVQPKAKPLKLTITMMGTYAPSWYWVAPRAAEHAEYGQFAKDMEHETSYMAHVKPRGSQQ